MTWFILIFFGAIILFFGFWNWFDWYTERRPLNKELREEERRREQERLQRAYEEDYS